MNYVDELKKSTNKRRRLIKEGKLLSELCNIVKGNEDYINNLNRVKISITKIEKIILHLTALVSIENDATIQMEENRIYLKPSRTMNFSEIQDLITTNNVKIKYIKKNDTVRIFQNVSFNKKLREDFFEKNPSSDIGSLKKEGMVNW